MDTFEEKVERLKKRGIVLTLQRLAVLQELGKDIHATAEDIYKKLVKRYPTISRATIYSSLDALKQAGEIRELTIRRDTSSYDFDPDNHHHFLCRDCGRIYNVDIKCPVAKKKRATGHRIDEVQGYFYGVCRCCLDREKKRKKTRSGGRKSK